MSSDPNHSTFDRDLDLPRPALVWPDYAQVRPYYRVIANPGLAIVGWLAAVAVCRIALEARSLWLVPVSLGLFLVSFLLFQFHCLDCGKTDFSHRLRRHRCDAVWARWNSGAMGRWHPPGIKAQLVIWFYVTLGTIVLIATRGCTGRL